MSHNPYTDKDARRCETCGKVVTTLTSRSLRFPRFCLDCAGKLGPLGTHTGELTPKPSLMVKKSAGKAQDTVTYFCALCAKTLALAERHLIASPLGKRGVCKECYDRNLDTKSRPR